jgi:hypothetical protein
MIGSETFIIVALRCAENSTPSALAVATCALRRNASRAAALMNGRVDDLAGEDLQALLEHDVTAICGHEHDAQKCPRPSNDRLLVGRKSWSGPWWRRWSWSRAPGTHRVRVLDLA